MSDFIKHECGIALIRLRKPLQYYIDKYDSPRYAINRLNLLMEKQHNRGQDGAGVANIKIDVDPGVKYISRARSIKAKPIEDIFKKVNKRFRKIKKSAGDRYFDAKWMKENWPYTGELWLGHLRYGTHGKNSLEYCHPMLRQNNWRSRNLVVAGNFNMTNVDELFSKLVDLGQHPKEKIDTVTVMEKIGHFLDEENQRLFNYHKVDFSNRDISRVIEDEIDIRRILERSCKDFDGGYAMAGLIGSGSAFVARDPAGIRPAYYYADDEVVVVASEKPAIKIAFNVDYDAIQEVKPGHALIINKDGSYAEQPYIQELEKRSCSFERIYFSRGTDPDIYNERKDLGKLLIPSVMEAIDGDIDNTIFSYIPNTAETSFLGMMEGLEEYLTDKRLEAIQSGVEGEELEKLLRFRPRVEKLVIKDAKLRTFITDDEHRDDLVAHVYDTTYGVVKKQKDTLVVIDDSIVRGTTLEKSILRMLGRLEPKRIVIVSSAPQIRYPDCYGIDMSKMREFVAFRAMKALLEESGKGYLMEEAYDKALVGMESNDGINHVQMLYDQFTDQEISNKIAEIIRPDDLGADLKVVYQTVENLHKAIPGHSGDWYFTGNYPTSGGNKVVNTAFVNYMEGKLVRAY